MPESDWKEPLDNVVFHGRVTAALHQLQLLDVVIKAYLEAVYWTADRVRPGGVRFLLSEKQLDRMPFGSLLRLFRRHCDDAALLKKLEQLEGDRIHIAHRIMLWSLGADSKTESEVRKAETAKAHAVAELAKSCTLEILAEVRRIRYELPAEQRNPEWRT